MIELGELFINAINHWRDAKGIGTALIPFPLNDKLMVLGVLQRIYSRSPTCKIIIVVNDFNDRRDMIDFLTQQQDEEENNAEFKKILDDGNIKIFTYDFLVKSNVTSFPFMCIVYRPESMGDFMVSYLSHCKFKLVVLNKLFINAQDMTNTYKIAPLLPDFKQAELEQLRLSTPVEETQIGITIPTDSEDAKLLAYYTEYVNTSIAIFGSFEVMQQAHMGNQALNISSFQICNKIALENGWNENLDMNIEFNVEIDRLYNPMALKERASQTYEVIRNRNTLLSDYKGKLDEILKIVHEHPDKKILIINKRADFASVITDYINNLSETNICMNYHDKVDNIPAIDDNGKPIVYKSGLKKGQPKTIGSQAQKTLAIKNFNLGKINVLSTNAAPDKDLDIDVDIIIITSPQCEDISSYMYRLSHLYFSSYKIDLFSLYCRNTSEQKLLENKNLALKHNVKNVNCDENISDFVVAD